MSQRFTCPHCGGQFKIPPSQQGQSLVCPKCSATVRVGSLAGDSAVAPAAAQGTRQPSHVSSPQRAVAGAASAVPTDAVPPPTVTAPRTTEPPVTPPAVTSTPTMRLPAADQPAEPVARQATDDDFFSIRCRVCDTRIDVQRRQIGKTVRCPDCLQMVPVQAPPPAPPKPKISLESGAAIPISPPVEREQFEARQRQRAKSVAEQMIEKAQQELDEDAQKYADFDGMDWATWKAKLLPLSFVLQITIWPRWILSSFGLACGLFGFQLAFYYFRTSYQLSGGAAGTASVASMITFVAATLWTFFWTLSFAPKLVLVFQETAGGRDQIQDWPSTGLLDNLSEYFSVMFSAAVSIGPPMVLVVALTAIGLPAWLGSLLLVVATIPVHAYVFLSLAEQNSLWMIYSAKVWESIRQDKASWTWFGMWAVGLGFLAWIGLLMALGSILGTLPAAVVLVFVLLVYYRVLGFLAARCAGTLHLAQTSNSES